MNHPLSRFRSRTAIACVMFALGGVASADQGHRGGDGFRGNGGRDHDFRDRGGPGRSFGDRRFFDDREFHGSRGYPVAVLPARHDIVMHHGVRYFYGGGFWYRGFEPGRFVVVAPPFGIVVPMLPPFYTTLAIGGALYYFANNTYYQQVPQGYAVVEPPPGNPATTPASPAPTVAAGQLYAYPRQGQSPERQAADRTQCDEWAVGQTGYDPRFVTSAGPTMATQNRDEFRRAVTACMEGRGYTVR